MEPRDPVTEVKVTDSGQNGLITLCLTQYFVMPAEILKCCAINVCHVRQCKNARKFPERLDGRKRLVF